MPVSLSGQSVIVAGASSGIGRATAVQLAREGARVMASARRTERLEQLQDEMAREGRPIEIFSADAADCVAMEALAAATVARFGRVDILVYATGNNVPDRSLKRLTPKIWDWMISINLNGAYYLTQAVLPGMREQGSGHLLYVSSCSSKKPDISGAAYQASKRGMNALAHAIRIEERQNGIRTSVVNPGLVDTEILDKRPVRPDPELLARALQSEDVAEVIVDLLRLHPRAVVTDLDLMPTWIE
ncbi:MAG: SDR family NAD(P)-dependent oxidoreductase [Acidobacteria bacterium]|nr:SDR family NAD(P)-dependent oxidoreductase [Acidobacteriota bacterium]